MNEGNKGEMEQSAKDEKAGERRWRPRAGEKNENPAEALGTEWDLR